MISPPRRSFSSGERKEWDECALGGDQSVMTCSDWARQRGGRGAEAERRALDEVLARGMSVLGVNVRVGHLELDIVARDGDAVVVIEVRLRGRGAWQRPLDSIGPSKRRRLRRAATILWDRHWSKMRDVRRVRFDVVAVSTGAATAQVEYVRAAF